MSHSESPSESPSGDEAPAIRPAGPPFDDATADIVVRSSDGVDFRLYKVILSKASPAFEAMLSLPIDPAAADAATSHGTPVLEVTEDGGTIMKMMKMCYPVEAPSFDTLDEVCRCLQAAEKYDMAVMVARLVQILERIVAKEPLRVYAIAVSRQNKALVQHCARRVLQDPSLLSPTPMPVELASLPSSALFQLEGFVRRCTANAVANLENLSWTIEGHKGPRALQKKGGKWYLNKDRCWVWFQCSPKLDGTCETHGIPGIHVEVHELSGYFRPASWWWTYVGAVREALRREPGEVEAILSKNMPAALAEAGCCLLCPVGVSRLGVFQ